MTATWRILEGDCVATMHALMAGSIDAIVTDPPYGLGFMGKEWDSIGDTGRGSRARTERAAEVTAAGQGHSTSAGPYLAAGVDSLRSAGRPFQSWCEAWATEALRVLKPGGYLLAFGGTRTYHRLTCAIEDAGFEVRDCLAWLYGSGFPKSLNLDGDQQGWGTALKPAHEPIVLARKPLTGTVAGNVLAHGTGALNVDGCRIGTTKDVPASISRQKPGAAVYGTYGVETGTESGHDPNVGRWPANVVLDPEAAAMLDEQTGGLHSQDPRTRSASRKGGIIFPRPEEPSTAYDDHGGASRFFYVAKADTAERNIGLHGQRNPHPTVKPVALMRWLCRLVTPPGGTVLDPFTGSGTTGIAAMREGFTFLGIEREAEYVQVARDRIIGDAPLLNTYAEEAA